MALKRHARTPKTKRTTTTRRPSRKKQVLEKFVGNPILAPEASHEWESKATFNPAAIVAGERVYLLYRAIGSNDVSMLGWASSKDGITIDDRMGPAYAQERLYKAPSPAPQAPSFYTSGGGGSGGSEDPRLTAIGDTAYLLYTAFNGWDAVRIALTSISLDDFTHKRWNWKKPVFISPPGEIHKNWVLFPEKINGRFAILHDISPRIRIEFVDSMDEFDGTKYIQSSYERNGEHKKRWDSAMRGAGPPPIKTKDGWLLLYHATHEGKYKLGAMLLDLKDPAKILRRFPEPILEPREQYETEGLKGNIVYCCGAVVKDGQLFVYYGGADTITAVATAPLEDVLSALKQEKPIKLKSSPIKRRVS